MKENFTTKLLFISGGKYFNLSQLRELKNAGFVIKRVHSAFEAMDLITSKAIDIVVTSTLELKDTQTLTFLSKLREVEGPFPPFVYYAPDGLPAEAAQELFRNGANSVLEIELGPAELVSVLEASLYFKKKVHQRREERFQLVVPVEVAVDGNIKTLKSVNLSKGGVYIGYLEKLPEIGTKVSFKIAPSEKRTDQIEGVGIVRWVKTESTENAPAGFGIEFQALAPKMQKRLKTLLLSSTEKKPSRELRAAA